MSNETTSIVYNNTVEYAKTFLAGANAYMGVATEYVSVNQLEAARASSGDAIDLDPAEGSFMRTSSPYFSLEKMTVCYGMLTTNFLPDSRRYLRSDVRRYRRHASGNVPPELRGED